MSSSRRRRGLAWASLALPALALVLFAAAVGAEVTATHKAIISFDTKIFPRVLPRNGAAPVQIQLEGHVKARPGREPAALNSIQLAIHRAGSVDLRGLPVCDAGQIDPASTARALEVCGDARIGHGRIRAQTNFPGSRHFYFNGRVTIFNGRLENGRPAILLHVYNATPPTSFVFPLAITHRKGRYRTLLTAHLKIGHWSRITDFKLVLDRTYRYHGARRSYLNAGCPAPKGFAVGISPFVIATLGFADGTAKHLAVVSSCRVSR